MRKRIKLSACVLTIFLLCSCADVPENLSSKNETQIAESSSDDNIEMMSLSEISENKTRMIENILSEKFDNITFPDELDFYIPEEIGEYSIVCIDGFQNKSELLFNEYVPKEILESCEIIDDLNTYPYGPYVKGDEKDFYCGIGCTGFFALCYMESVTLRIPYDVEAEKTLYTALSAPGSCEGFDVSPALLKENADSFASDFARLAGSGMTYSSDSISSYNIDGCGKFYHVDLRSCYKGLSIFDILTSEDDSIRPVLTCGDGSVVLDPSGKVQSLIIDNSFESYGEGKAADKIVSPQSAAAAISRKLSGNLDYDVLGMQLVYIPTYEKNIETVPDGEKTRREKFPWSWGSTPCSYDVFKLTPYWVFIFNITPDHEIIGFVNAIDGSTEFIKRH